MIAQSANAVFIQKKLDDFIAKSDCERRDIAAFVHDVLLIMRNDDMQVKTSLTEWYKQWHHLNYDRYSSELYAEENGSALNVAEVKAQYAIDAPLVDGR